MPKRRNEQIVRWKHINGPSCDAADTELMWRLFTSFLFSSNARVNLAASNNVNKYGWWDDQNIPPGPIHEKNISHNIT